MAVEADLLRGRSGLGRLPSGRTVVVSDGGEASAPLECAGEALDTPTRTEQKALDALRGPTRFTVLGQ
ncbi:hypothetical protein AB0O86_08975 [Streptomyces hirsutus]|uniref:hypothetical protein n=1 Tax=Streptomyces hirsutus TaxID=35620 RepID=UPI0034300467